MEPSCVFRNMSLDSLNSHEKLNRWPKSFYLRGSQNGVKVSFNHHCISKITVFSQNLYSPFNNSASSFLPNWLRIEIRKLNMEKWKV